MISINILTVRPTSLIGDSNRATACKNNERAAMTVDEANPAVPVSLNVLMKLVIGRVHRWHET